MKKTKFIIIGLDGGTFKIIDPLISEGKLPNLKRLIEKGTKATLISTIPPLTAPAWVTLMTGVNPGKHGLFDFRKLEKITYDTPYNPQPKETCVLMHSHYYAGKTIWDILGKAGLKISTIMMPMTYPAWEVNGYMLSGYPSPDFKKPSGYPLDWVTKIGPLFDMPFILINNEDILIKECRKLVNKVEDILIKQLKEGECDVYSIVFSSTDFLQHYLWKYQSEQDSKYKNAIRDIYIEIDKVVGRILELVDCTQCSIAVLSDHGFMAAPKKFFHVNAWLSQEGYLLAKDKSPLSKLLSLLLNPFKSQKIGLRLRVFLKQIFTLLPCNFRKGISGDYYATNRFIWPQTKAFRYRVGTAEGIAINLRDRQPAGIVGKAEYEQVREQIIKKLKELRDKDTGAPVVSEVYKREEVYKGRFIDLVPDIIFMFNPEYKGGVGVDKSTIIESVSDESSKSINGVHDMDGILVLNGPKFKENKRIQPVNMVDILPILLHDLDIPIPSYTDGIVVKEAFKDELSAASPRYSRADSYESEESSNMAGEEEDAMKKALKGLGYLS